MLDGWRAVSILCVLAGHLLPLGPASLHLNEAVAAMGMAIFFTLSGFLITRFLSERAELRVFIIRRFFRIVPLAWVAMTVVLLMSRAPIESWVANFLFYANLPPFHLVTGGSHLWSLGVEVQFYVGAALWVALFGQRGLYAFPLICLAVTGLRVWEGTTVSIVTWLRVDEILSGATLALIHGGWFGERPKAVLRRLNVWLLFALLLISARHTGFWLEYFRPYIAAAMVGTTLYRAPHYLERPFTGPVMAYIANISYALYIIHGVLVHTWLGEGGSKLIMYAKRPLLFAATFALAHFSTFRFEQPCIDWAKRLTRRISVRAPA